MKKNKLNSGFSLIEMLVVIFIFAILAVIVTQSLATSLRGTRKSEALGHVRENIEYAMTIMERSLRSAKELDCSIPSNTILRFETSSGADAYFECADEKIASASGGVSKNLIVDTDVVVVGCGADTIFTCKKGTFGTPDTVEIQITARDKNTQGAEAARYTSRTKILLRNY